MTEQSFETNPFYTGPAGVIATRLTAIECTGLVNKTISVPEGMQAVLLRSGRIEAILDQPGKHAIQDWTATIIDYLKGSSDVDVILVSMTPVRLYWGTRLYRTAGAGPLSVHAEGKARIVDVRSLISKYRFGRYLMVSDLESSTGDEVQAACQSVIGQVQSKDAVNDPSLAQRLTFEVARRFQGKVDGIEFDESELLVEARDPAREKVQAHMEQLDLDRALSNFETKIELMQAWANQEFRNEIEEIQLEDYQDARRKKIWTAEDDAADAKRLETIKHELIQHNQALLQKKLIDDRDLDELAYEINSNREERDIRSSFRLQQLKRKARDRAAEKEFEFKSVELQRDYDLQLKKLTGDVSLDAVRRNAALTAAKQELESRLEAEAKVFASELQKNREKFDETVRQENIRADQAAAKKQEELNLKNQADEQERARLAAIREGQLETIEELSRIHQREKEQKHRRLQEEKVAEAETERKRFESEHRAELERFHAISGMTPEQLLAISKTEQGGLIVKTIIAKLASQHEDPERIMAVMTALHPELADVFKEKNSAQHQKELAEVERRHYEARFLDHKANSDERIKDHKAQMEGERLKETSTRESMVDLSKHALDSNRDIASARSGYASTKNHEPIVEVVTRYFCPNCKKGYEKVSRCPFCEYQFQ